MVDDTSLVGVLTRVPADAGTFRAAVRDTSFLENGAIISVAGAAVLAIGFCGCCGALKESRCLLLTVGEILHTLKMVSMFM